MPRFNVLDLDMTKEENIELREQYINTIKESIMKYGSAFVGTGSPNSSDGCAYYDSTLKSDQFRELGLKKVVVEVHKYICAIEPVLSAASSALAIGFAVV